MNKYKDDWWYSTSFIVIIALFSILIVPAIVAITLSVIQIIKRKKVHNFILKNELLSKTIQDKNDQIVDLDTKIKTNESIINDSEVFVKGIREEFEKVLQKEKDEVISKAHANAAEIVKTAESELKSVVKKTAEYNSNLVSLTEEHSKLSKEVNRYLTQARKFKSEVTGLKNFETRFPYTINTDHLDNHLTLLQDELSEESLLGTVLTLHLHSNHSKELRKLSNATKKEIKNVLEKYEERYTTKTNKTIYHLMIIGLQAEIQILLFNLRYHNINESIQSVKDIITKYLAICTEGNKGIISTITKFLTEIETLYIELVQIEFKYYVYHEQEKEEQKVLKEQMKQEAKERKQLAEEQKKLDNEASKFKTEMERNKELLLHEEDDQKVSQLRARLIELENQMKNIEEKKEEISNLALGKAGYVYIISNLGSFGDNMFKIGMTRRMLPYDRIDELGSASVPFKFDVHALVFSDDAVGLEQQLHKQLTDQRVNKINYRKEFFRTNVEELRELVEEIDPTVEFITTMIAEEYRQTEAMKETIVAS